MPKIICTYKKRPQPKPGRSQSQSKTGSYIARRRAAVACRSVNSLQVGRRGLSAVSHDLVADLLSFVEGVLTCLLDRRDVDENIFSTIVRLDEAEALRRVEPFNSTSRHSLFLPVDLAHSHAGQLAALTNGSGANGFIAWAGPMRRWREYYNRRGETDNRKEKPRPKPGPVGNWVAAFRHHGLPSEDARRRSDGHGPAASPMKQRRAPSV